jgi:hypothetical protein
MESNYTYILQSINVIDTIVITGDNYYEINAEISC